ncbi:MAG: gluconate 2-dehydrogenase subunit 3 family protein [Gemmatimonas sp.]|uniref:gluconate 2-dehydrogenase subunit 3 family protein n=1 Tax=Gemmatimonas sp. TaxID=1962908 RepID=UPI00391B5F6D
MRSDDATPPAPARRHFLKTAGVLAVGTAAVGSSACDVKEPATVDEQPASRRVGFDRVLLDALASTVLPAALGEAGVRAATDRFVAWADGYDPVAEEMHGYGYADVRYLPADPVPAWRAQLDALDMLARKSQRVPFVRATPGQRSAVVEAALRAEGGERLPAPLAARHVALALLAHWSASPEAWNLALGAQVSPLTCRKLDDAVRAPLPLAPTATPAGGTT